MLGQVYLATIVLYGQEVLNTSAFAFGLMTTVSAIGGVLGGWLGSRISRRIGSGLSVQLTLWSGGVCVLLAGLVSQWPLVALLLGLVMFTGILWNVITVSLRQSVIPDRLLGRVNSVYRFFGWGMMPIGSLIGGGLVAVLDGPLSREWALRMPWIVAGAAQLVLALLVVRSLSSSRIDAVRAGGKVDELDVSAIGTVSR